MSLFLPSRRKFLTLASGLIAAPAIIRPEGAWAQVGQIPGWPPIEPVVSSGSVTYAYKGFVGRNITGTTETFLNFAIGTAAANRVVAVAILVESNPSVTVIAPVTIGGVTATQGPGAGGSTDSTSSDIWYALVPTGTTATIAVTLSANVSGWGIAIGVATINTSTPTAGTGANNQLATGPSAATTVTIPSGGVAFTGLLPQNHTATFSNMIVDDTQTPGGGFGGATIYFGHQTITGTDTATFSASDRASMSTLPWGP